MLWDITDVVTANRNRLSETPAAKRRSTDEMECLKKMQDAVDDWEAANNTIGYTGVKVLQQQVEE
jgi:hypothetical protein